MNSKISAIVVGCTTIFVYFLTTLTVTKMYVSKFFLFYVIFTIAGFTYHQWAHKNDPKSVSSKQFIFLLSTTVLMWIGVTGWYFSPFFYLLYLLGVLYAFLFTPGVTFVFITVLSVLFLPNLGIHNLSYNIVTLLSLFSVVPLTFFLQKEYLNLKESEKRVLVLEEQNQVYKSKVDEALANQVTKVVVGLKEPINDVKQTILYLRRSETTPNTVKQLKKIEDLVENALSQLEDFETSATGKKLVHTKRD